MADPVSAMAAISLGSTLAGGAMSAAGSIFGGQAKANMYNYQAGIAQLNAQIAQQNANYALAKGEVNAQQSGMKTRFQVGETKALQAASGIDVNRGSTVAARVSEEEIGSENQSLIRSNARMEAFGYQVKGLEDTAQSQMDKIAAQTSITAGNIGAASSILGTIGSVSGKWAQGAQSGIPLFQDPVNYLTG